MKTITAVGFLVLAQQASAQTLPLYSADTANAQCIAYGKDAAKKDDPPLKAVCSAYRAFEVLAREELAHRWNRIDPSIRLQCIDAEETFQGMESCIKRLEKQGATSSR